MSVARAPNLSIRWKVALGALVAVTLGFAIAAWLASRSLQRLEIARLGEDLQTRAALASLSLLPHLTGQATPPLADHPEASLPQAAYDVSRVAAARVTLVSPEGVVLADSEASHSPTDLERLENHGNRPEVQQALASGTGSDIRTSRTTGERFLYVARRLPFPDGPPLVIVRLALPLRQVESQVRELEQAMGIAFGIAFVAALALSVLLARSLTRPLLQMAAVARRLAEGALGQRVRIRSQDEVGVLATTLNQMAEQLESKIQEVSEDRAQLLAMLVAMVEGVMVLDCRGIVLQVNPALERMFHLHGQELRGRAYHDVIHHEQLGQLITAVLQRRQNQGEEMLLPTERTLRVEAAVAGGERENEACVVLVFHDVTALRRLEKVRQDFVANVSHELRTPLTSIKGYVEALLDGANDDPREAVRFLEIILKQSDRLNLILGDLLQLAQIESGQGRFKREPVSVHAVLERTLALIKPLADKKQHVLTVSLPAELPAVLGDEDRLAQVFTNLLDNAVKYTPSRGTITIGGRSLPDTPEGIVEVWIADSGLGIPEADRPRIFERFYRVDKARSRELGGTGLGLAIVKHIIVEGHGGRVWVESHQPRGSRFILRLPAAADLVAEPQHPQIDERGEEGGARQGEDPGVEDPRRHSPPHC